MERPDLFCRNGNNAMAEHRRFTRPALSQRLVIFAILCTILYIAQDITAIPLVIGGILLNGLGFHPKAIRQFRPTLLMLLGSGLAICLLHLHNGSPETGWSYAVRLNVSVWVALLLTRPISTIEVMDLLTRMTESSRFLRRFQLLPLQAAMVLRLPPAFGQDLSDMRFARIALDARRWSPGLAAPLIISALDDADRFAKAITARGFIQPIPSQRQPDISRRSDRCPVLRRGAAI